MAILREVSCSTDGEPAANETLSAAHLLSKDWQDDQPLYQGVERRPYTAPQLHRLEHYQGNLAEVPEDNVRALLAEMFHYFNTAFEGVPLPPTGLPGVLHEKYDRHEPAAALLWLGFSYFEAAATGKGRAMHNRWKEARALIRRAEDAAREKLLAEIHERESRVREQQDRAKAAKPQLVYFIAADSGPIKIGTAANPQSRCKELQTSHHEKLTILATCKGGQPIEIAYHRRFAAHRLNGEWFERHPDIMAEIDRLASEES